MDGFDRLLPNAPLAAVMENIPDALFLGNADITAVNPPALDLLGCASTEDLNRRLAAVVAQAREEERRAVAYELHDGLTQYVLAAHAHLDSFRWLHDENSDGEEAGRELDRGLRYLKHAVLESRRFISGLRALALDDRGLAGALEQLLDEEKARAGWREVKLVHNIVGRRYNPALETGVFRVAQEALTNARKHAGTERVRLRLHEEIRGVPPAPRLCLEVRDWGRGFAPGEKTAQYGHLGLQGMLERVRLAGGTYRLYSAPGAGTIVCAVFPASDEETEIKE